ncbi:MAG TPA: ABC transporter substrate-binding protein [bacterium]|jgi:branched-chain amino acid transport system substrate-binding protein
MKRIINLLAAGLLGLVLALSLGAPSALAQKTVKIGLIGPLSGPWARQGALMKLGAEMAVDEVNSSGGIKSLGGAKLELIIVDAGDSAEKAKNAAQRLISQEPDLVGGMGSWLSSFTLAVTEVTERASLPWLTLSYSDQITNRGFHYVYQTSATGATQATQAVPVMVKLAETATGERPKTVGIAMDNTAAPVSFAKPLREGGLANMGLKLVMDEIWTPPLSDATPIIQKVRSTRPDLLLMLSSAVPDDKLLVEKMNEFKLGKGRVPVVGNGAHWGVPELLSALGPEQLQGFMFICANWGMKGQEDLIERFKKRTGEPWLNQDSASHYGHVWILKEALERAGKADRVKVNEEIQKMDLNSGPAATAFAGHVKFQPNGRRDKAEVLVVQWQNGVPVTVYPLQAAQAKPFWPKR